MHLSTTVVPQHYLGDARCQGLKSENIKVNQRTLRGGRKVNWSQEMSSNFSVDEMRFVVVVSI